MPGDCYILTGADPGEAGLQKQTFDVYVVGRKGRPRWVDEVTLTQVPSTWGYEGTTYYFVTADLSKGTLTYSEHKPAPVEC